MQSKPSLLLEMIGDAYLRAMCACLLEEVKTPMDGLTREYPLEGEVVLQRKCTAKLQACGLSVIHHQEPRFFNRYYNRRQRKLVNSPAFPPELDLAVRARDSRLGGCPGTRTVSESVLSEANRGG